MTWESLLAISFASYRVTRLIVDDTIWDATRVKLIHWLRNRKLGEDELTRINVFVERNWFGHKAADLISCSFCTGVWVTAGACAWWAWLPNLQWAVWVAAATGGQALLASWER